MMPHLVVAALILPVRATSKGRILCESYDAVYLFSPNLSVETRLSDVKKSNFTRTCSVNREIDKASEVNREELPFKNFNNTGIVSLGVQKINSLLCSVYNKFNNMIQTLRNQNKHVFDHHANKIP